jgi:hypothetical protein
MAARGTAAREETSTTGTARQDDAQGRGGVCGGIYKHLAERGSGQRQVAAFPALAQPGDEGLIVDPVVAGEGHRAPAAAIEPEIRS